MSTQRQGNMLIAQSGGPTAVINQSLVGAIQEAAKHSQITGIYGALHGVKGVLEGAIVDLGQESPRSLEVVANTPSAGLGSVRKKPSEEECAKILSVFEERKIAYFFYIGGNDSAETALIIDTQARQRGLDIRCFHIPKTIDNDLRENDHTPGYGSAARFVACAFMGDNLDNLALPGVKIDVVMGRHAGFLTAASALARVFPDDGPHLVYLPEKQFDLDKFLGAVDRVYKRLGRCLVAVSEGIVDKDGKPVASRFLAEKDSHNNVQLSGSGALGDLLADAIRNKLGIKRVRADTFGYLQRSFVGTVSQRDAREARAVGVAAVQEAVCGPHQSGSIAVRRRPGSRYQIFLRVVALERVAHETRQMPPRFMDNSGHDVTKAFINYARPIVGDLPPIGRLSVFRPARD